jgi:Pyruvate/2-oxoacid:ferredoxin oxidoreductase gamma subunit
VTIGETFAPSQRGGSVMSHVRISSMGAWSPQIPKGKVDLVVRSSLPRPSRCSRRTGTHSARA